MDLDKRADPGFDHYIDEMDEVKKVGVAVALWLVFSALGVTSDSYYASYYGFALNSTGVAAYTSNGTLSNCTNVVAACNASEPRRIDGTCNNLNHPSYGASRTPYYRMLSAVYNKTSASVFDPKLSESGKPLKLARVIRTNLVADGKVQDERFTHCMTHLSVFYATDITNTRDTTNYVTWRPYCCDEKGKTDVMCAPNAVPADDYTHRYNNIRCLNMTRPLTYQTSGCLANTTTPLRIVDATPLFDLSPIYGNVIETARRTYVNGSLATETVDDRIFPVTTGQLLLGINFIGIIFFWKFHNFIASKLLEINPCWTDEQIFSTGREINIAFANQILYYELMPQLMGTDNLVNDGVICDSEEFRDIYDETVLPQMSLEFPIALRWMHKMQDGTLKFYNSTGTYLNQTFPMVNLTSRISFIKENGNMDYITQGCFRQASAKVDDHIADPDILNLGLGGIQRSNDIMTNDLAKNRYFGLQPYVYYREYCFGDNITSFDELDNIIDTEIIETLKDLYDSVNDIDLLAGIWSENIMDNSYVPPTFYCLVSKQLLHNVQSDRHWYESSTRPNAFTADQLSEIRKASVSRMLCDIGDSVTEIQPSAFLLSGSDNEVVSCDEITEIDYTVWADATCTSTETTTEDYYYDDES